MKIIATVKNDFPSKFGLPRQGFAADFISGEIIFEKPYRNPDFIRGLDGFSHIWVLWLFSDNPESDAATVRPPLLGGNERKGVFATRSSFRPNGIGMTALKLEKIEYTDDRGPVLKVSGCDMKSGTPIIDIKPYLPSTDAIQSATGGFAGRLNTASLEVKDPDNLLKSLPQDKAELLRKALMQDPRPRYIKDDGRVFGFEFCDREIKFSADEKSVTILKIEKIK
ncbi:MAG: tRNA (N6-threonylcarbamoyladenosine(37)-N6)-methyltransferase TrmO [Oscillospiraceae bacterium]|nr:tRNA (N6-threonylcarbamoyladenosine(37)-N6)-methyltransferase TrmO [Candidatus Equicaccousia limihippi]